MQQAAQRGTRGQGRNVLPFASPQRELVDAARRAVQQARFQFDLDEQGSSYATGVLVPVEEFSDLVVIHPIHGELCGDVVLTGHADRPAVGSPGANRFARHSPSSHPDP